jgi:hypothetical protein
MMDHRLANSGAEPLEAQTRLCPTYAGRTRFRVVGSVAEGAAIWPGKMGSPLRFSADFFATLLARFAGSEVEVGASFSGPTGGSLGEYIQSNLPTRMNPAVYVAGLLIEEGYAERTRRGWIRFFRERHVSSAPMSRGSSAGMPQLNRRLVELIGQLSEDEAGDVLRFVEERVAHSKQRAILKTLGNDPALAISESRLGRFDRFLPRSFPGKPLSQIVIEERR